MDTDTCITARSACGRRGRRPRGGIRVLLGQPRKQLAGGMLRRRRQQCREALARSCVAGPAGSGKRLDKAADFQRTGMTRGPDELVRFRAHRRIIAGNAECGDATGALAAWSRYRRTKSRSWSGCMKPASASSRAGSNVGPSSSRSVATATAPRASLVAGGGRLGRQVGEFVQQLRRFDRLGDEIIHARCDIFRFRTGHRVRRQRDDRDTVPRGRRARICRVASTPSRSGICTSISTAS